MSCTAQQDALLDQHCSAALYTCIRGATPATSLTAFGLLSFALVLVSVACLDLYCTLRVAH